MLGRNHLAAFGPGGEHRRFCQGVGFPEQTAGPLVNSEYGVVGKDVFRATGKSQVVAQIISHNFFANSLQVTAPEYPGGRGRDDVLIR